MADRDHPRRPLRSAGTMQSWRLLPPKDPRFPLKLTFTFVLAIFLSLFFFCLQSPFKRLDLRVAVVKPDGQAAFSQDGSNPCDLALLLAQASGRNLVDTLDEERRGILLPIPARGSLSQAPATIKNSLDRAIHPQTTLVLYLTGVLSMDRPEPSLCDSSRDAMHGGGHVELLPFIAQLQQTRCRQILLCVDAIIPWTRSPYSMGHTLALENARGKIERQLMETAGVPIAVLLSATQVDREHPYEFGTSMASKMIQSLNHKNSPTFQLNEFQSQLILDRTEHDPKGRGNQRGTDRWLVSKNWPIVDPVIPMPKRFPRKEQEVSTESDDESLSTLSIRKLTAADASETSAMETDLDHVASSQLILACKELLAKWRKQPEDADSTSLGLPLPYSREQAFPLAFHRLDRHIQDLEYANKVAPWSLNRSLILATTLSLLAMDRGQTLPGDAPTWINDLRHLVVETSIRPSPSLVINSVYESAEWMRGEPVKSRNVLRELLQKIESSNSHEALSAWMEDLSDEIPPFIEWDWIRFILAQGELPWESKRTLLLNKLLSIRLSCDPMAFPDCLELIHHGDEYRIRAERELVNRSQSSWQESLDEWGETSRQFYTDALHRLRRKYEQRNEYREKLVDFFHHHPWSHRKNGSMRSHDVELNEVSKMVRLAQSWIPTPRNSRLTRLVSHTTETRSPLAILETPQNDSELLIGGDLFGSFWYAATAPWNPSIAQEALAEVDSFKDAMANEGGSFDLQWSSLSRFDHGMNRSIDRMVEWLGENSGSVSRDEPIWYLVSRLCTMKQSTLTRWMKAQTPLPPRDLIEWNLERLEGETRDATEDEFRLHERLFGWWGSLGKGSTNAALSLQANRLVAHFPATLNLNVDGQAMAPIELKSVDRTMGEIDVVPSFEGDSIRIWIDGQEIESDKVVRLSSTELDPQKISFQLSVQLRSGRRVARPILLHARRGEEQIRLVLGLKTTGNPMALLHWTNSLGLPCTDASSLQTGPSKIALFPNRTNPLAIEITNLGQAPAEFGLRLLLAKEPRNPIPHGVLSIEEGQRWKEQLEGLLVVAEGRGKLLGPGERRSVLFAPNLWEKNKPFPVIDQLLIETRDDATGRIQFDSCALATTHVAPSIHPLIHYDSVKRQIQIQTELLPERPLPPDGLHVDAVLESFPDLTLLGKTRIVLTKEQPTRSVSLSLHRCESSRARLRLHVEEIPNCYVYAIPMDRSSYLLPCDECATIQLEKREAKNKIVQVSSQTIEVEVEAVLNESGFDPQRDRILAGVDRNGNRSLSDDVAIQLQSLRQVQFLWTGVDPGGFLGLQSNVSSHRLGVPIDLEWHQQSTLLATLHRGSNVLSSQGAGVIFDRKPPRVLSVRCLNSQPSILGIPLRFEVQVDDDGLSGGGLVEGCWSTAGELEINASVKTIPAIYRDGDRWLLTLPTDTLPSGVSLLLVRAIDRAGNVGECTPISVELWTSEELKERLAQKRTLVHGSVHFSKTPIPNLKVSLIRVVDKEAPTGVASSNDSASTKQEEERKQVIASTLTSPDGSFVMNEIPSGKYRLDVEGIVRGMREKRSVDVEIHAPIPSPPIHLRMDKKP